DQAERALVGVDAQPQRVPRVDLDARGPRRGPVAEPAVDGVLRGPQRGDRPARLGGAAVQLAEHPGERAAAAVRRGDADERDAGAGQVAPGDRQGEREGRGEAGDGVPVVGADAFAAEQQVAVVLVPGVLLLFVEGEVGDVQRLVDLGFGYRVEAEARVVLLDFGR